MAQFVVITRWRGHVITRRPLGIEWNSTIQYIFVSQFLAPWFVLQNITRWRGGVVTRQPLCIVAEGC